MVFLIVFGCILLVFCIYQVIKYFSTKETTIQSEITYHFTTIAYFEYDSFFNNHSAQLKDSDTNLMVKVVCKGRKRKYALGESNVIDYNIQSHGAKFEVKQNEKSIWAYAGHRLFFHLIKKEIWRGWTDAKTEYYIKAELVKDW